MGKVPSHKYGASRKPKKGRSLPITAKSQFPSLGSFSGKKPKKTRVKPHSRSKPGSTKKKSVKVKGHSRKKKEPVFSIKHDLYHRAQKPGKRRSADGSTYYEYRQNRTDKNPRKRI